MPLKDQLLFQSLLMIGKLIVPEFLTENVDQLSIMLLPLYDTELKMDKVIGSLETLGDQVGEKKVTLDFTEKLPLQM